MVIGMACLIVGLGWNPVVGQAPKEKEAPVSGTFKGNGQDAKLMFATALQGEPYLNKPTTVLILTEKDHSKEKMPKVKAYFGDFGSALIITITNEGKIIGCEVAHSAHKKSGFSSIGEIKMSDFKMADGKITGSLATNGEVDTFKEKWEVKLKINVPTP